MQLFQPILVSVLRTRRRELIARALGERRKRYKKGECERIRENVARS